MEQTHSVLRTNSAHQLWDTKTDLNVMQRRSIELGTKHRLQLIQGPPGIATFVRVSLIGSDHIVQFHTNSSSSEPFFS